MRPIELRHCLAALLLQAESPLPLADLASAAGVPAPELATALDALLEEGLVVRVPAAAEGQSPGYRWSARWREEGARSAAASVQDLAARQAALQRRYGSGFDILDPPAVAFHEFVVGPYRPPAGQRWLVLLQCSVRRPFSASPSHASLRRAVALATGFDPGVDRGAGPAHVVVLASRLGPVPYDLEDVYPASVRSGGVKDFDEATYARYRPVLAARLAAYLAAHREHYLRVAAFGEGRYAEVMRDASRQSGTTFPLLPETGGLHLTRLGDSRPRKYWERYWIQLFVTLTDWLDAPARQRAAERLQALDPEYA